MNDHMTTGSNAPAFDAAPVVFGGEPHQVSVYLRGGIAHIAVVGDPEGKTIYTCIQFALTSGMMLPRMPTLVDITRFSGSPLTGRAFKRWRR